MKTTRQKVSVNSQAKTSRVGTATPAADQFFALRAVRQALFSARDVLAGTDAARALAPELTPAEFDAAVLALSAAGKVVLHYHDAPHLLSAERRNSCVVVPSSRNNLDGTPAKVYYHAVGLTREEAARWA